MKKILGISLCALFAVSAANADIASKLYVDGLVGANTSSIDTLTGRVSGHDTSIATNADNIATNTTNITNLTSDIQGMDFGPTTKHYVKIVSQENGSVSATDADFADSVSATITNNAPTSAAVAAHVKSAISALNATETTRDYVKKVKQENGEVIATDADFDDQVTATSENAPTSKAVASYVTTQVQNATPNITTGTTPGAISVNDAPVSVYGLGTAAYENVDFFATAAEGDLATNALQPQDVTESQNNGKINVDGTDVAVHGLQAMAYKASVATADIDADAVTTGKIANGTIMDADINSDAQIASSKIAFETDERDALDSGITEALVTQIGNNAAVLKPSEACMAANNSAGCTLVVRNGRFSWEAVARADGEQAQ